jgi:glycolate oxidase FAD binding subunit
MPSPTETLATLAAAAGGNAVRPATAADAIDGVQPATVVEPATPEKVAAVLAAASAARLIVVIRGGGSKIGWGRVPAPVDVVLSTRRLSRIVAHAHGDLTAEVESGVPLAALNEELGKQRQWLPLESAFPAATIGGMLATNDAGPARHRFGTPRDLLIGVQLATPDGRLVRAGGNVVKNVAGYDLGRLVTGSFGSLAAIVSATFKLTPIAPSTGTQRFTFDDRAAAAAAAHTLAASQLDPVAIDVHAGPDAAVELLVRFASTPAVVEGQMAAAVRLLAGVRPGTGIAVTGAADQAFWREYEGHAFEGAGAVLKVNWLPAALDAVLTLVAGFAGEDTQLELTGRAGLGVGVLRVDGSPAAQADLVRRLRDRADVFDRVTILRAAPAVKASVDVWGDGGGVVPLLGAIKRAFDPAGILNAGRGPI